MVKFIKEEDLPESTRALMNRARNLLISFQLSMEGPELGHMLTNMLVWHIISHHDNLDEDELMDKVGDLAEGIKKAVIANYRMMRS